MRSSSPVPYFHAAGTPFIAAFIGVTILLFFVGTTAFFIGLLLTGWCLYFFRDPARVSVFLNVFNVHVNRIPCGGEVIARRYRPGKFVNASLDKASVDNERMGLTLRLEGDHPKAGETIGVVQIAGLIARRILCDAQEGHKLQTGERYGIIRFGSRTDIYLPQGVAPLVSIGQTMIGGETIIADCASPETIRLGEVRE